MKKLLIVCIALVLSHSVRAQEAVQAYATGADSYLLFASEPYDASKKYTVIRLSPEGDQPKAIAGLAQVADVVACEWKTSEDINEALGSYAITGSVKDGNLLKLTGPDFTLNTTSPHAYLVLLDQKPQLLCCGADCEKRLAAFFPIRRE